MSQSVKAASFIKPSVTRTIFRWIHIIFGIPIIGYIYTPFDQLHGFANSIRYVAVPVILVSGLWMWKGHVVRRLFSKKSTANRTTA